MEITLTGRSRWVGTRKTRRAYSRCLWRSSFAAGIHTVSCPNAAENRLSDLLMRQAAMVTSERVTLGDMAEFLGDRSIGGLLLGLALPMALPVPAPGISVLFGVPLIVISAQLALGYHRPWLPACSRPAVRYPICFYGNHRSRTSDVAAARAHCAAACRVAGRLVGGGADRHHLSCAGSDHNPAHTLGSRGAENRYLRTLARSHRFHSVSTAGRAIRSV
jgi:Exopolysaccharide synthesis, ExoD